jgi:uncharacterized cofD-like protein
MTVKHVVTIGGGTGQFALLAGLRDRSQVRVSAVVSMVDSGGSTGRLRDELGILPPGDVLKCILALSPQREVVRGILLKRFQRDRRLAGHTAGNMLLTMLSRFTGSFPAGVAALAEVLDARGTILPVTLDKATLVAELTDGSRIFGERAIDVPRGDQREKIREVHLVPHHKDSVSVYPPVLAAIAGADLIVLGPGDLFTSIVSNLVVPGVKEALQTTGARLLFVVNIMTKFGETHQFSGIDFVQTLESHLMRPLDVVVYNTTCPDPALLEGYTTQKSDCVAIDAQNPWWGNRQLIAADLLDSAGGIIRHHPEKLANVIISVLNEP